MMQMLKNPQVFIQGMMNNPQVAQNPMAKNLFRMIKSGDIKGVEQFGRNIASERNIDFDKAFADFKSQFPTQ